MGPDDIVMPPPSLDQDLGLAQRVEVLPVEQLVAETGIEALAVAVLPRRSRFDEKEQPLMQISSRARREPAWHLK